MQKDRKNDFLSLHAGLRSDFQDCKGPKIGVLSLKGHSKEENHGCKEKESHRIKT